MNQFSYITSDGQTSTVQAKDAAEALRIAPNIAKDSGVQLMQPSGATIQPPQTTGGQPIQGLYGDPNKPSSSANINMQQQYDQTKNIAMESTSGAKPDPMADITNALGAQGIQLDPNFIKSMVAGGYSVSDAVNLGLSLYGTKQAEESKKQSKADQDRLYNASLAQQNEQYRQASMDLAASREKDLNQAKTTAAQLNPYSGANTDEDNYSASIGREYSKLQGRLDSRAAQAKAALDAGNMEAYARINNDIALIKQQGISNIQNILQGIEQKRADFQKLSLQTQEKYLDNYRQSMTTMPLPTAEELNSMSLEEIMTLQPVQVGLSAGLPIQTIIGDISRGSFKQQQMAQNEKYKADASERAWSYLGLAIQKLGMQQAKATSGIATPEIINSNPTARTLWNAAEVVSQKWGEKQYERFVTNVSDDIASGDYDTARGRVMTAVFQDAGATERANAQGALTSNKLIDDALGVIAENSNIPSGPWRTLLNTAQPWLLIQRNKDFVALNSLMTAAQAPIKKNLYGSAITSTELKDAQKFLAFSNTDSMSDITTKLGLLKKFNQYAVDNMISLRTGGQMSSLNEYGLVHTPGKGFIDAQTGFSPKSTNQSTQPSLNSEDLFNSIMKSVMSGDK